MIIALQTFENIKNCKKNVTLNILGLKMTQKITTRQISRTSAKGFENPEVSSHLPCLKLN